MEAPTTILLGDVRPTTEARLRAALQDVDFVPLANGVRQTLRELSAEAALVKVDRAVEPTFQRVRDLAQDGLRVVALGTSKDPDLILRCMREGAKEFVLADDDEEIVRVVREQVLPLRAATGRVYAVFPAKGGVGATTLATNLAGALQRIGEQTCLVDLNLEMGDVLAFLDLTGGYSISDAVANAARLDRELLDSTLLKHASGVRVLAQAHRADEPAPVQPAELGALLAFLRSHHGAVVLDGLRTFDETSVAALDACDRILLVVTQEVPAVRDARRCFQLLERLGVSDRVKLVVNRFDKGAEIGPPVIAETVGAPVAATIPNDYPAVLRGINRGQLLFDHAPRAQVTRSVAQLVSVVGHAAQGDVEPRPSLLRRFLGARTTDATT
jgi:pilus assembly protein CpaE